MSLWVRITSSPLIMLPSSLDPADGSSKSRKRCGLLHVRWWKTEARPGADVQPAGQRKGHSWWDRTYFLKAFTYLSDLCAHHVNRITLFTLKFILLCLFLNLQINCTDSWKTTVIICTRIVAHMWSCLSSSEKTSDYSGVCCEDSSAPEFTFKSNLTNVFNSRNEGEAASLSVEFFRPGTKPGIKWFTTAP